MYFTYYTNTCKYLTKQLLNNKDYKFIDVKNNEIKNIDEIIIAEMGYNEKYNFMTKWATSSCKKLGYIRDDYWHYTLNHKFKEEYIQWIDMSKPHLYHLEVNLISTCNLKCKSCSHFSQLCKSPDIMKLEDFEDYMKRLSSIQIVNLYLLGGEPTLIKDLPERFKIARKYFPDSTIAVLTNGTMLQQKDDTFYDSIRDNGIEIVLSLYPKYKHDEIKIRNFLIKKKVKFCIKRIITFIKTLTENNNNDPFISQTKCLCEQCRFLHTDGRIYKCPISKMGLLMNEEYGTKFPESKSVTIEELVLNPSILDGPVEMCYYCSEKPKELNWKESKLVKKGDWIV